MLKALVQLFAEKFLVSRREWISQRSVQISPNATAYNIEKGSTWYRFIAPFDGWAVVAGESAKSRGLDVFSEEQTKGCVRQCISGYNQEFSSASIPVKKGQQVTVAIYLKDSSTEQAGSIKFLPFESI